MYKRIPFAVTSLLLFLVRALAAAPLNDEFGAAMELLGENVSNTATNSTASTELGEPASAGFKTLWWRYRPTSNGRLTVTTTGSSDTFNKTLSVYLGASLPTVRPVATSIEGICCSSPAVANVSLPVIAHTDYLISVGCTAANSAGGRVVLGLSLDTQADIAMLNTPYTATMANDFFANRILLTGEAVGAVGYNVSASNEAAAAEPTDSGSKTLWWTYRSTANGRLTITTTGSDSFSKSLAVYLGTNFASLRLVAKESEVCCNNPAVSIASLPVTADTDYQVSIGTVAANSSGGAVVIAFSLNTQADISNLFLPVPAAAANDNFANRVTLTGGTVSAIGYNTGATREPLEPTSPNSQQRTIWWTWTAPAAGTALIDLTGSDAGTKTISVWRGAVLSKLSPIATSSATARPTLSFTATAGESYQIAVGSPDARNAGNTVLTIAAPPGDPGSSLANIVVDRAIHFRWFATKAVRYQVQSSSDEVTWTNAGSLVRCRSRKLTHLGSPKRTHLTGGGGSAFFSK